MTRWPSGRARQRHDGQCGRRPRRSRKRSRPRSETPRLRTRPEKNAFLAELRDRQDTVGDPGDPESGVGATRGDRPVQTDGKDVIQKNVEIHGQPKPDDDSGSDFVGIDSSELEPTDIRPDDPLEPGGDMGGHGGDRGNPRTPGGGGGEPNF